MPLSPAAPPPAALFPTGPSTRTRPTRAPQGETVYSIRADVHYSLRTNTMTALLELPGLARGDVQIGLAPCRFTRAPQLTISGRVRAPFPPGAADERDGRAHTTRERKYGPFVRRLHVPPGTQVRAFACLFFLRAAGAGADCGCHAVLRLPSGTQGARRGRGDARRCAYSDGPARYTDGGPPGARDDSDSVNARARFNALDDFFAIFIRFHALRFDATSTDLQASSSARRSVSAKRTTEPRGPQVDFCLLV